ncbi:MAG: (d)CMP kinase [Chlamydiota bacterium]
MIITIDGPAGTGKSTIAQKFADAIGFAYFDTGALYRAISWQILETGIFYRDDEALSKLLKSFSFRIRSIEGNRRYFVGNEDVTKAIRSKEVTTAVLKVASLKKVRDALKPLQLNFSKENDVVFEGRDLGTVIFPDAYLKFFLTARPEIRAKRRYRELVQTFPDQEFSYEIILKEIQQRDAYDSTREEAPLKQARDAVMLDTSDLTIEEVTTRLKRMYLEKKEKKRPSFLYASVIVFVKIFFKVFYRHKVYGLEHYPEGSGLVAPNHGSFFDPPCVAVSCPDEVHFLARETLFKSCFGKLISALNAHPVKKSATNLQVMKDVCQLLKERYKVLMFPEGTRSTDNDLLEIKPGIGLLLSSSRSLIIPTYIHGTFDIWNRKRRFPKLWGRTAVVFGSPIHWRDFKDIDRKKAHVLVAERLTNALKGLRKWYEEGHRGLPP